MQSHSEQVETEALSSVKLETDSKGFLKPTVHVYHADPMEAAKMALETLGYVNAEIQRTANAKFTAQLAQSTDAMKAAHT